MIGLALAAAVATAKPVDGPKPWELAYYRPRVTAGAQCAYANGVRTYALFTGKGGWVAFLVANYQGAHTDPADEDIVPVKVVRGGYRYEANGGPAMVHQIDLALDYLTKRAPRRPISGRTLDAFLHDPHPPSCERATFEADLYDKK